MKLLLDTHLLLWAASEPKKLSATAKKLINTPGNTLYFSAASLWEITIKQSLGRADFQVDPRLLERGLRDNGYQELSIASQHAVAISSLLPIHKDPFDRMLLAQAMSEGITLLTADPVLAKYPGAVRKI